ncbi:MAG: ABC transporter ATP-binding protein [Candidatus Paceibacterota bacterium]
MSQSKDSAVAIETRDIHKSYFDEGGEETKVLQGISFSIKAGEFVAIMGPSGSGKSTLLHILGFLDYPTSGEYYFGGRRFEHFGEDESAKLRNEKIGFVFQAFNLLPRTTVFENVRLPLFYSRIPESEWQERTERAIDSVGLSHRMHHESAGLSGGEKQRVAIARALVVRPEIIFADEPTGNLDSKSGQVVMDIIRKLNEEHGHTIVLITHETYTAEQAGRIIRIKDGSIESDSKVSKRSVFMK